MNEIDELFRQLTSPLAAEGVGAEVAQPDDAPFLRDGTLIRIQLHGRVVEALHTIVTEYRMLLEAGSGRLAVLFPDAYEGIEKETENTAWSLLTGDVLRAERLERCDTVLRGLEEMVVALEAADDWMRVFNDLRLVAAGRDIEEEYLRELYRGDTPAAAVFLLATAVLGALLDVA